MTPPPIDEVQCEITDASRGWPLCRRANITSTYASAVRDIGAEFRGELVVIDIWNTIMEKTVQNTPGGRQQDPILGSKVHGRSEALVSLMPDGLHLNDAGYKIFFNEIISAIEKRWPDDAPLDQPSDAFVFPYWAKAPRLSTSRTEMNLQTSTL